MWCDQGHGDWEGCLQFIHVICLSMQAYIHQVNKRLDQNRSLRANDVDTEDRMILADDEFDETIVAVAGQVSHGITLCRRRIVVDPGQDLVPAASASFSVRPTWAIWGWVKIAQGTRSIVRNPLRLARFKEIVGDNIGFVISFVPVLEFAIDIANRKNTRH